MTASDLAGRFERFAVVLRRVAEDATKRDVPLARAAILEDEMLLGAAVLWTYMRDLIAEANRDHWTRDELLKLLAVVSRDTELFPAGLVEMISQLDGVKLEVEAAGDQA